MSNKLILLCKDNRRSLNTFRINEIYEGILTTSECIDELFVIVKDYTFWLPKACTKEISSSHFCIQDYFIILNDRKLASLLYE